MSTQMSSVLGREAIESAQQRFVAKVFWWMFLGLLMTGVVSAYVLSKPEFLSRILNTQGLLMGLVIAEFGLVIGLSAAISRLSSLAAMAMFFLYAALNGLTLSVIFAIYTAASLKLAFFISAGTFGAMCFYGYVTKKDLTKWGNICFMGLFGIIIASVVNYFFYSPLIDTIASYVGVLVFVGLTAYDSQKIKEMGPLFKAESEGEKKSAIIGALRLYLDFINLFLMILRIFGRRR